MINTKKLRVIVVGAGFGGVHVTKALVNQTGIEVTLIDRRNFHLFQPLLYQVATGSLNPADIAIPIREMFRRSKNVSVVLGEVTHLDLAHQMVGLNGKSLPYDYLVVSCGSKPHYFGHPEWEKQAPSLKTLEDSVEIRRKIFWALERAEVETNLSVKKSFLTFAVIGGGPTGVELAGAIGEIALHQIESHYRNIRREDVSVYLIEGGPRILPSFRENLSQYAADELKKLGVTVLTNSIVSQIESDRIFLGTQSIELKTMIWAAGVTPSSLNQKMESEKDRAGRVVVDSYLNLAPHPNVFVIGDQSFFQSKTQGQGLPGTAPVAIQQGIHAARLILADLHGGTRTPFQFKDKGSLATIGRARAVAQFQTHHFTGFIAWVLWCVVHVYYLIGFRNKVLVLLQWAWAYIRFQHGSALIAHADDQGK